MSNSLFRGFNVTRELLTKQVCRDELVVYSLFFSPTTNTSLYLYVLSTFLRISNFTLIYKYIYIYIVMSGLGPLKTILQAGFLSVSKLRPTRRHCLGIPSSKTTAFVGVVSMVTMIRLHEGNLSEVQDGGKLTKILRRTRN